MPNLILRSKILIFLALLLPLDLPAQPALTETSLRQDVEFLSGEFCQGRGTGTRGAAESAFFLLRRFREAGLEPRLQTFDAEGSIARNVIAEYRGDYSSDRYILVCAYYDGLGVLSGRMYPGADANASGVAALLAAASRIAAARPRANYLFAALDGHMSGLSGAQALYGYRRVRLAVNLDTVGSSLAPVSSYWPDYLIALGGTPYEVGLEKANKATDLRLYYDYYGSRDFTDFFYRKVSDQKVFVSHGIPAVMFTSGITDHTNKESDTASTLDYRLLCLRARLISDWLLSL
ncbi:MAG: M28 family peptidase [Bacteroidales bacterium]|nr:M28 family peptidase [Bacteroidales bacterium]